MNFYKIPLTLLLIVSFSRLFSQDTIVKLNGQIILAKVLEVSPAEIKYKRFDYLNGPDFNELKSNIEYISYKNGVKEKLNSKKEYEHNKQEENYANPSSPKIEITVTKHRLSFSVNLIPILINDASIYIDYCHNERHSIGISLGAIYPNSAFQFKNNQHINQSDTPGAVYNGYIGRLNYKLYYSKKRKQYVEAEFLYKYLTYSNITFINHDDNYGEYKFTRSETTNVYNFNILYGCHFIALEKRIDLEFNCGLGYDYRVRNYTTTKCDLVFTGPVNAPYRPLELGSFHSVQKLPSIMFGLKIGANAFFRKKK